MVVVSFILLGVLLVIVQTTLCMPSPVWWLAPDFSYVLVGYLAYRLDLVRSVIILFPLGCTLDVLSGTVLGLHSLLCYGGYFLLRFVSGKLPVLESLYQIPLVATSFLAVNWCAHVVITAVDEELLLPWSWWRMLVRALLVALFALPLFRLFDAVRKITQRSILPWNRLHLRTDNRRRRQD
ncbi:MAG: hypothetical protein KA768_08995 [Desulfobulbus sp.]|uniref:hypothetical protein n=1 Tax=uncultured Desulfobulbus sp. TaxID=239745 RepID=UPI001B4B478D|nr:hypothetical protein [uncultured Desulfobulbus sp.]MBP7517956.1 hypothetical protein [Desulfobulbus sp.]